MKWEGVFPAMTTAFQGSDLAVDHGFVAEHARWLVDAGSRGLVVLGSLGEGATLSIEEKRAVAATVVKAVAGRVPVVAGISSLATAESVELAKMAAGVGCEGLMVLPPYVYVGDWREMKAHVGAVLKATPLSCMLYNNPIAYKTDFVPVQIAELAEEFANLAAVKESSADVRRIAAIRELVGERLALFVGVDDLIVEGIDAGAVGWIAGLVNALPKESVVLFDLARAGRRDEAWALYRWFLPLLRLDVVPKFVQLIKLVQQEVGMGSERVRPPRLELVGGEREDCLAVVRAAMASRPRA